MKAVLVMCDGFGDAVARARMGYLEHLTESGLASRFVSRAALPTASRMNYETIHTGLPPHAHGITSNHVVRRSSSPNLFTLASDAGLKTAAVAFFFISELYHRAPTTLSSTPNTTTLRHRSNTAVSSFNSTSQTAR